MSGTGTVAGSADWTWLVKQNPTDWSQICISKFDIVPKITEVVKTCLLVQFNNSDGGTTCW